MSGKIFDITTSRTIVFTGGGTGGHIYPNLALLPEFARRGFDAAYIGGENDSLEKRLATQAGINFYGVPTIKLARSLTPFAIVNDLKIPRELSRAKAKAAEILRHISPDAVFSKGGFASLPATLAAKKLGIPVFAHESDLTLGLANKLARFSGATLMKANPHAKFKAIEVGMPIRETLIGVDKQEAAKRLKLPETSKPTLLVLGGSSGAKYLNDAVFCKLDELTSRFFVLHILGKNCPTRAAREGYMCFDYADNIGDFYAVADVVLSRAGATAVFEISALNKRAVFVPLPKGISRGDQLDNAELAREYGGSVLCQNDCFLHNLLPSLQASLQKAPMRAICADSNGKIADVVCDSLRRGVKCKDKKR